MTLIMGRCGSHWWEYVVDEGDKDLHRKLRGTRGAEELQEVTMTLIAKKVAESLI